MEFKSMGSEGKFCTRGQAALAEIFAINEYTVGAAEINKAPGSVGIFLYARMVTTDSGVFDANVAVCMSAYHGAVAQFIDTNNAAVEQMFQVSHGEPLCLLGLQAYQRMC